MNTNRIDNLSLELSGIKETLVIMSGQFANQDNFIQWRNETISAVLSSLALHLERINEELDIILDNID